jgi:hypothetical protein
VEDVESCSLLGFETGTADDTSAKDLGVVMHYSQVVDGHLVRVLGSSQSAALEAHREVSWNRCDRLVYDCELWQASTRVTSFRSAATNDQVAIHVSNRVEAGLTIWLTAIDVER